MAWPTLYPPSLPDFTFRAPHTTPVPLWITKALVTAVSTPSPRQGLSTLYAGTALSSSRDTPPGSSPEAPAASTDLRAHITAVWDWGRETE